MEFPTELAVKIATIEAIRFVNRCQTTRRQHHDDIIQESLIFMMTYWHKYSEYRGSIDCFLSKLARWGRGQMMARRNPSRNIHIPFRVFAAARKNNYEGIPSEYSIDYSLTNTKGSDDSWIENEPEMQSNGRHQEVEDMIDASLVLKNSGLNESQSYVVSAMFTHDDTCSNSIGKSRGVTGQAIRMAYVKAYSKIADTSIALGVRQEQVDVRKPKSAKVTKDMIKELSRLIKGGMLKKDACAIVGMSKASRLRYLNENGDIKITM
jgi:hypothetical protein